MHYLPFLCPSNLQQEKMVASQDQQDKKSERFDAWGGGEHKDCLFQPKAVPLDLSISTFSRFGSSFEAYEYSGWIDESVSWKTDCYIGDWSPLAKARIKGPEAKAFLEFISTNQWPNFRPGQAKHAIFCHDHGLIIGEGLIMMLAEEDFLFTSVPGVVWLVYQFHHGRKKFNATLEVGKNDWTLLQVQGPKSVELLDELSAADGGIRDIKFMQWKEISINGHRTKCLRQGVSGELGFELWGPIEEGRAVYSAILEAGRKYNIRRLGARAKMVNHRVLLKVEAAFATPCADFLPATAFDDEELNAFRSWAANDFGINFDLFMTNAAGSYGNDPRKYYFTPFDLGWGRLVNFDHDFIGREALVKVKQDPPNHLVTLVWNNDDVVDVFASLFTDKPHEFMEMPRALLGPVIGSTVQVNNSTVGVAVSRCYSYWFKKTISLGIVDKKHSNPGTAVEVIWGSEGSNQKTIRAVVQPAPYKEDKRRHTIASESILVTQQPHIGVTP
ncbi:glycine cleavage t protein (aminomethyl transferase) [Paramyrothecium foliicola]|nr:glycine cleavage t protein (aminomethyl transferase) [Paramyrothecium foliicola]